MDFSLGDPQIGSESYPEGGGDPTPFRQPPWQCRDEPGSAVNGQPARDYPEGVVPRFYDSPYVYSQPRVGCVDADRGRVTPRRCSSAGAVDGWNGVRQCKPL